METPKKRRKRDVRDTLSQNSLRVRRLDSAIEVFNLALAIAIQNESELHIVSVGEIDYFPQFVKDISEQRGAAVQRLRSFVFRVRPLATGTNVKLHSHVWLAIPSGAIERLALKLDAELLVIGAACHWRAGSFGPL